MGQGGARTPSGWRVSAVGCACLAVAAALELWIVISWEHQHGADHWLIFGLYAAGAVVTGISAVRRKRGPGGGGR